LVTSIYHNSDKTAYRYDKRGNIAEVYEDGELLARYGYDALNRLIREDNAKLEKSFTIEYDTNGNILRKNEYPFTLNELVGGTKLRYRYDGDRLMSFDKKVCQYDELGNPTVYKNKTLQWDFRNLKAYGNTRFDYNASGIRLSKKHGDNETKFYLSGTKLLTEKRTQTTCEPELGDYIYGDGDEDTAEEYYTRQKRVDIEYLYGANGIMGFITRQSGQCNRTYYYRKNLQGDITHIFEDTGTKKVLRAKYIYDAWGNCNILRNDGGVGSLNAIRYRGYYYDNETGLYYLQSRYYDPETGRFISPDAIEIY
jgi:RHS repeat-associated protein